MIENAPEKIKELMSAKRPVTLGLIAKEVGCTALEAAQALPAANAAFVREGISFEAVWERLAAWEKVTFFVIHEGHVFEIATKLSPGKTAMGYFNMLHADAVLGGHIKADALGRIAFISMPFMGRESHYVAFFGKDGTLHFSVYVGREKHQLIESVKEAFFKDKAELCEGEAE